MPINVKSGESEQEFVNRCVPIEIGYGKGEEQATAICYSIYQNRNMTSQERVLSAMNDINLYPSEEELKLPCTSGYEQYGMKIKNGRKVPNCIPIKN
tara:strand:+ start:560 stop:850 length:291 start_codon:yes stop_codon:yes gene_type:complete